MVATKMNQWKNKLCMIIIIFLFSGIVFAGTGVFNLYIQNSSGANVAKFSNNGSVVFNGSCSYGGTCNILGCTFNNKSCTAPENSLQFVNSTSNLVAYIASNGSFCTIGNITQLYNFNQYNRNITKIGATYSGTCSSPTLAYDENFSTSAFTISTNGCYVWTNFSIPANLLNGNMIEVKMDTDGGDGDAAMNISCYNYTSSSFADVGFREFNGVETVNFTLPVECLTNILQMKYWFRETAGTASGRLYEDQTLWYTGDFCGTYAFQVTDNNSRIMSCINSTGDLFANGTITRGKIT